MTPDQRDEITASVAAHEELGPRYDAAVAEGLVERIGEEIDKRVDARLRTMNQQAPATPPAASPATPARGAGSGLPMAVVSLIFGTGATSVVLSNAANNAIAQTLMVLLIWTAIAVINVANARRR
jgi:hypothetical protein